MPGIEDLLFLQNEPYDVEDYLGTSIPQDLGFIGSAPTIFTPTPVTPMEYTSYGPSVEMEQPLQEEGLASLKNLIPGSLLGTLLSGIFGKEPPEVRAIKDFYAKNYGVNTAGSVDSGIMQGYNPVSGGFLNMITGGRYGEPMQVGLANAARRRIENIVNRKAPQTEASRAKIQELQKFAETDTLTRARAAAPDVYRDAGDKGRLGSGGGFSTSGKEGAFSSKSGRGRQDY